jgi:hypothetical protein
LQLSKETEEWNEPGSNSINFPTPTGGNAQ